MAHSIAPTKTTLDDLSALSPGQVIDGRFVLDKLIGRGGQGMVFLVRHLEWNQDFALKLPLPSAIESEAARERFIKEAETWIRMGVHPNIVRCWFVRPVVGLPGLFLDLATGGSLDDKIKKGEVQPGQWDRIILILIQIAEGLTHSHAMGVVHRDLKPENLLVNPQGKICITDFGLVKTLTDVDLKGTLGSQLPETNTITEGQMGTPRYGAPEQWTNPSAVCPATDLYSFGAIMFELLCGRRPFEPPGAPIDPVSLINRHISETPPDPLTIRDDIPLQLVDLCLQLLAKEPEERGASSTEVLERLMEIRTELGGAAYQRPSAIPAGDRPTLLNNAAASLFSVGRAKAARELLLKGLMIEAGHAQCLFNLVQLDRREGKIDRAESFRRLRRAKAHLELALLYLEEGVGKKAGEHLERIKPEEKSGYIHRTEGDALMYDGRFPQAAEAYEKAHSLMPNDKACEFRVQLAKSRSNGHENRLYFPSLSSTFSSRAHDPKVAILLNPEGNGILGISNTEVVSLSTTENRVIAKKARPPEAGHVRKCFLFDDRLIVQDRTGFEMWGLPDLTLRGRQEGIVLTANRELTKLILLTPGGVVFFDVLQNAGAPLVFPPEIQPSPHVLASFNPTEDGIGLLTPDGRIASIQGQNVVPFAWPPPLPDPSLICAFKLGHNSVTVVDKGGVAQCLDLAHKTAAFRFELGFVPDSLETDSTGTVFIFSSPVAFTILTASGRLLLRGRGPFAVTKDKTHGLVWSGGVITLFQLSPFHVTRRWTEKIPQPQSIRFSANESRAVTLDSEGHYRVWEVDESNRVYERNLLVAPGQSYEELITSYEDYLVNFREADDLAKKGQYFQSYEVLQKARSVLGFQQAEEALNLQWELCHQLQREGLEATWERLFISDTVSAELSSDSQHLLIVKSDGAELFHLSGPRITQKLSVTSDTPLMAGTFSVLKDKSSSLVTVSRNGELCYRNGVSGDTISEHDLSVGKLRFTKFHDNCLLACSARGEIISWDLQKKKLTLKVPLGDREFESAFPLASNKTMVITKSEFLMLNKVKSSLTPGLPLTLERLPGGITFVGDLEPALLRMTGFSDGTLIISNLNDGRPLLGINQENGPVSGACLNIAAALGVSVSSSGGITLFGLDTGRILERFVAHTDGVAELTITEDGRYLTTRSMRGEFRLWELSWKLSDRPGHRKIDWLPNTGGLAKLGKFFKR